ncbi:MAG TPA: transglycosylase family protein [Candidatus Limnocylindrales bacterium]|nr:transglycosylase family protein [Candidatus Limnocylindrales bacterium]
MPEPFGRRRGAVAALIAATVLVGIVPAATGAATAPPRLDRFMYAIGQVESGGRYDARNPTSGAYGKYQIMPANWRAWARTYLGNASAPPTPRNQERVARAKFTALWTWLKDWRVVAHWWLTGSKDRNSAHWSPYSRRYVNNVMAIMTRDGGGDGGTAAPAPAARAIQESSPQIVYAGSWSLARHPGYAGGAARYSTNRGAIATLTFRGRSVAWVAPVGPTRGRAEVSIDGKLIRTVDLFASRFVARRTVFTMAVPSPGQHTLTIRVLGTPGRRNVSIDEFGVAA